jgi:hypothetical protein
VIVIFEMLEMVFIPIYFLLPYEILGMAGQVRSGYIPIMPTYSGTRPRQAGSSGYKQGQAGTIRDYKRTSRGNSDKQDTIISTHFSSPGTVDLIYTMAGGAGTL